MQKACRQSLPKICLELFGSFSVFDWMHCVSVQAMALTNVDLVTAGSGLDEI